MLIKPKKSLGQNFLIDKNIILKIIKSAKIRNKNIIEIGPGTGNLTNQILKNGPKSLITVEKDNNLSNLLEKKISHKNFKILNKDILKINLEKLILNDAVIFGNLPYNISTQILVKLIKLKKWPPNYSRLVLMFQKEVAERIIAKHNTTKYGRLSVISNWRLNLIDHINISKNCFYPKPKVDSMVLIFKPKVNKSFKIKHIFNLEKITQIIFSNKRKMINKNIKSIFGKEYDVFNLNLSNRPNNLRPDDYYRMTEYYEKKINP